MRKICLEQASTIQKAILVALAVGWIWTSPAEANHKAGHGSPPLGDQTTTLSDLDCADGEVAKWNGTTWACAADEDSDMSVVR